MEESKTPNQFNNDDVRWLHENANLVFIGKLQEQKSELDDNGLIFTTSIFEISQVVKGDTEDRQIEIKTLGGAYKGEIMKVSHMPEFYYDYTYLIFSDPEAAGYNAVVANTHGVFIFQDDEVYKSDGYVVSAIENNKIITGLKHIEIGKEGIQKERYTIVKEDPESDSPDLIIETIDPDRLKATQSILSTSAFIEILRSITN